jgi:hypothetical protein
MPVGVVIVGAEGPLPPHEQHVTIANTATNAGRARAHCHRSTPSSATRVSTLFCGYYVDFRK